MHTGKAKTRETGELSNVVVTLLSILQVNINSDCETFHRVNDYELCQKMKVPISNYSAVCSFHFVVIGNFKL